LSRDDIGVDLPDLDAAYLEAFRAAQEMWSELLAERSDPFLRSFEISDTDGRALLTLPFREVLPCIPKGARAMTDVVRSASDLLERTRALTASLREQIVASQKTIEATQKALATSQRVLESFPAPARMSAPIDRTQNSEKN
jgi:hypothetical protein